jgi:hypothetical protein
VPRPKRTSGSCHGAPAVKRSRFRHKQPTPPRQARGPLYLFRVAVLRTLLTAGLFAVAAGFESRSPRQKRNMQQHFSFLTNLSSSVYSSPTVEEAAAFYLDPPNRLLSNRPEALTETEAETLAKELGFAADCFTNREARFLCSLKRERDIERLVATAHEMNLACQPRNSLERGINLDPP